MRFLYLNYILYKNKITHNFIFKIFKFFLIKINIIKK